MHRNNSYNYSYSTPPASRYSSSHGTSSAFSANANPNEDWTKISDLAERRRIQNRIAQRNYRKKLKRRLEDLERRAASSSASPEQSHAEPERPPRTESMSHASTRSSRSKQSSGSASSWSAPQPNGPSHEMYGHPQDDRSAMFVQQSTRQLSASPPPLFYSSFPYSEQYGHPAYPSPQQQAHHSYHPMPTAQYGDLGMPAAYLDPLPSPLQSLSSVAPPAKRLNAFADEEILNPLCINYASMAGLDMSSTTQQDPHAQTPPLTDSYPYDHSGSTSPAGSLNGQYPVTPELAPLSPGRISFV